MNDQPVECVGGPADGSTVDNAGAWAAMADEAAGKIHTYEMEPDGKYHFRGSILISDVAHQSDKGAQ